MKTNDGKLILPVTFLDIETNELAQEVGGWRHVDKLTMAVGVTFNEAEGQNEKFKVWRAGDEVELCQYLLQSPLVVGHNLFRFDYLVLWGALQRVERIHINVIPLQEERPEYAKRTWAGIHTIDTLATLKEETGRFIGLDNLGQSNLKRGKPEGMSGAKAPEMIREGRMNEVIAYCKEDVTIVRDLFRLAVKRGTVWYIDMRTRKPRFAKPGWDKQFENLAIVRGSKTKK